MLLLNIFSPPRPKLPALQYVLFKQTWGRKRVNLFVGDRHNRVVEFLHKVWDSHVGQEDCHRSQHQVDEDEHHCEDILQAGFAEFHWWTAYPDVILCDERWGEMTFMVVFRVTLFN